ncbi:MAG TPA: LamG-like jellyroll fold domain-containing protein, partial [Planctomycetota bacterium]|nr:LamG-like jellyroll fold domain-containing protein [Planctomycetota bacterium]
MGDPWGLWVNPQGNLLYVVDRGMQRVRKLVRTDAQDPEISLTPTTLSFATAVNTNPPNRTVTLGNARGGTFAWTVADDAAWLSVSPGDGKWTTGTQALTVSVDATGLTVAGSPYNATITVSSPEAVNSPRTIPVTLQVVDAPFVDAGAPLLNVTSARMSWGDVDNDGDLDLGLCGNYGNDNGTIRTKYYRNDAASLTEVDLGIQVFQEPMLEWGDYNRDGYLDLGIAGWGGGGTGACIYRGGGSALTRLTNINLKGMKAGNGHWEDFDNDGDLDFLLVGESYDDGMSNNAYIYRNDGGDSFTLWQTFTGVRLANCACADYDNDGDIDILIAGRENNSTYGTKLYRNDGGSFTVVATPFPNVDSYPAMAFGDYDNDGDLDLVFAGRLINGSLFSALYRNDNGTFVDSGVVLPAFEAAAAGWGDCDNDGDLDLVFFGKKADSTGEAHLYINNNGTFTDSALVLPPIYHGDIQWGDYDNDGKLDFVLAGRTDEHNSRVTRLYRNTQTMAANTVPAAPLGLSATANGQRVTFTWNAASDAETPAAGLSYNLRVGTAPGKDDICSGMADSNGWRKVVRIGNAQKRTSWTLKNLPVGTLYWSVQAIDTSFAGGAWAAEQSVDVFPTLRATAMSPAPGANLSSAPAQITVAFSADLNAASVTAAAVRIVRRGPDNAFGTADDVTLTPAAVSLNGPREIRIDLTGAVLPNDVYRVTLGSANVTGDYARWNFDENAGTTASDTSGNSRSGTLNGASWTTGVSGSGLRFDGANNTLELGLPDLAAPWSVAMWVKREASDNPSSNMFFSSTACLKLEQYNNTKKVGITRLGSFDHAFNYTAPVDTWVHLAYVGTSTGTSLYVNGALEDATTQTIPMPLTRIGNPNHSMKGTLDEVRVFNRALTAAEVASVVLKPLTDANGSVLDGEFSGTFPSGNGVPGGDFTADFTLSNPGLPIAHWKFDEASGAVASDSSGRGHDGAIQNSAAFVPAQFGNGNALSLNGSNQFVSVPHAADLNLQSAFTLSGWIYRSAAGVQHSIVEKFDGTDGTGSYLMRVDRDGLLVGMVLNGQNANKVVGKMYLLPHRWYHVAVTFDSAADQLKAYVDGALEATAAATINPPASTLPLKIGARGDDNQTPFAGLLDDVRLYDRALSLGEIQTLAVRRPVAVPDAYATAAGQVLNINAPGLRANDLGGTAAAKASDPAHGTVSVNANGSFTYTPDGDFSGVDSFTYAVDDGAPASVFVSVGAPSLTLLEPNGNDVWVLGTQRKIRWNGAGVATVKIELSRDNGAAWEVLATTVPANTGEYVWTVAGNGTRQGLIRISDADAGACCDLSDRHFTIQASLFTAVTSGLPGLLNSAAAAGDYNNDGLIDFALCGI